MRGARRAMRRLASSARGGMLFAAYKVGPLYGGVFFALALGGFFTFILAFSWLGVWAIGVVEGGLSIATSGAGVAGWARMAWGVMAGMAQRVAGPVEWMEFSVMVSMALGTAGHLVALSGRARAWIQESASRAEENARTRWSVEREARAIEEAIGGAGRGRLGGSKRRL